MNLAYHPAQNYVAQPLAESMLLPVIRSIYSGSIFFFFFRISFTTELLLLVMEWGNHCVLN